MEQKKCPSCNLPVLESFNFCPNCGEKLKDSSASVTISRQISIYALSILVPPLGLWPGIHYVRQKNEKAKLVGVVAIVLTILSTVVSIWLTIIYVGNPLTEMNNQLHLLKMTGY
jgi:hypothetical protein